jgi:hypothetical protein
MLMNDLACQYHIPYIDVGTGIFVTKQRITAMGGQVHLLLPDSPCLDCREALNRERAGQELLTEDQKALYRARGYVLGDEVVQPQVIQLNGVVANQAVTEFINLFAAFKPYQPYLVYDALKPGFLAVAVEQVPGCLPCSRRGSGDSQPEVNTHVDSGTETGNPAIPYEQSSNGGYMAKPIPSNPNFRKRTASGHGTRQNPAHPPPTPVSPTTITSQKEIPSEHTVRVAHGQPAETRQPIPPLPVPPPQPKAPPTPIRRSALRNWFAHLPRLF